MKRYKNEEQGVETQLIQSGRTHDEYGFVSTPIYRGSTVLYDSYSDVEQLKRPFSYGTKGSPTLRNLEDVWTELSNAKGTVLLPSGLGAIALALLSLTKSGDHILVADTVYHPTRKFCDNVLSRYDIDVEYYDPLIGGEINDIVKPNTSVIFLESPGSQTFEVQDVPSIVKVAKQYNIKTIIDNTWATPLFFKPHDFGIDVTADAGTKYLGGHSDLLLGLVTANAETWDIIRDTYDYMAMVPSAEDCFLALRGLRTMPLRIKEAERRGLEVAKLLKHHPAVTRVFHPALPDCFGHDIWKRDFKGSTGLFSIELNKSIPKDCLSTILDNMRVFSMGYSWGGFESLIIPFDCRSYRTASGWVPEGVTLRVQIGLEDLDDIKSDIINALDRATEI